MPKLTEEQMTEVALEMVEPGTPVRFLHEGCSLNICSGDKTSKGCNVMYQTVYWNFPKKTSLKVAKWLGARAVFSE